MFQSHRVQCLAAANQLRTLPMLAASLLLWSACGARVVVPDPPVTRVDPVQETLHGVEISDPYRWLEDQQSPETRAWIEEQNGYTDQLLAGLAWKEPLAERFAELLKIDTIGFPTAAGGRYFFAKRAADQDLPVLYMREGLDGEDQVLLDPHTASADHTVSYNMMDVSNDGTLLVYAVRQGGKDEITPHLFDVAARSDLDDSLPEGRYFGATLNAANDGLYYTRLTEDGPRVFLHRLGSTAAEDSEIFGEGYGPEIILFANLSEDRRHALYHVLYGASGDRVDLFYQELDGRRPVVTLASGIDASFAAAYYDGTIILETNWQAPNGRVMAVDPSAPQPENWREIVAERKNATVQGVVGVGGKLWIRYLQEVQSRVVSFDLAGNELGEIAFDTLGTVGGLGGRWDSDEAFFQFSSFHVPNTIYLYDTGSGERRVWARSEVPIEAERMEVNQLWFTSKDGTRIPMFVVHEEGLELDGSHPTLLTGYGGFNARLTPAFSANAAIWVEQGGVYAVANLRGGGEFGEAWHRAGMLENKQNTFDDFIAAAEHLIEAGYTRPEKLAIRGGSNGGLLVGAVANQRPDLFRAVICAYPLLDMLRYHQFLVAGYWVPEYGSAEDPEQFAWLRAYSPYHNVTPDTQYPAMMFITGDGDTRVAPLHARKMTALLQASTGSQRPVLLRYHTKAGHSGGQPVSERISNSAESFAFLLWQLEESAQAQAN